MNASRPRHSNPTHPLVTRTSATPSSSTVIVYAQPRSMAVDEGVPAMAIEMTPRTAAKFRDQGYPIDDEMVKVFKDHKVDVVTLTPAEYDAWVNVAKQSSYAEFAKEVPDGKQLIDEALAVK